MIHSVFQEEPFNRR